VRVCPAAQCALSSAPAGWQRCHSPIPACRCCQAGLCTFCHCQASSTRHGSVRCTGSMECDGEEGQWANAHASPGLRAGQPKASHLTKNLAHHRRCCSCPRRSRRSARLPHTPPLPPHPTCLVPAHLVDYCSITCGAGQVLAALDGIPPPRRQRDPPCGAIQRADPAVDRWAKLLQDLIIVPAAFKVSGGPAERAPVGGRAGGDACT
jgi:hypothetical protein